MTFEEQLYELDDIDDVAMVKKKEAIVYIIKMGKIMTKLLDLLVEKKELLLEDLERIDMSELEQVVTKMEEVITKIEKLQEDE